MSANTVELFEPSSCTLVVRGKTAIIEYHWRMRWVSGAETHEATGREILVLARRRRQWRIVWRKQTGA
jgi:hypothetical protein